MALKPAICLTSILFTKAKGKKVVYNSTEPSEQALFCKWNSNTSRNQGFCDINVTNWSAKNVESIQHRR